MGFFTRKKPSTPESPASEKITDNPTDNAATLVNRIIDSLKKADDSWIGLTVWATTEYYAGIIEKPEFEQQLRTALDNADMTNFGSGEIVMRSAVPTAEENAVNVLQSKVFISQKSARKATIEEPRRVQATVTVLEGTGSTLDPSYTLDSEIKKTYHIGRGKSMRRADSFRRNDIVINETDPDESIDRLNKHVSSAQADIVYCDSYFGLRAMKSGCRSEGGVATKILRDNSVTELTDSARIIRLYDGDMIELGKSVVLEYKVLSQ